LESEATIRTEDHPLSRQLLNGILGYNEEVSRENYKKEEITVGCKFCTSEIGHKLLGFVSQTSNWMCSKPYAEEVVIGNTLRADCYSNNIMQ
jgi:hypothetical protein